MRSPTHDRVRSRLAALLASLRPEDLEDRVAPVKCAKHPHNPECETADYAAPMYAEPMPEPSSADEG